jgi:hypothetical protein
LISFKWFVFLIPAGIRISGFFNEKYLVKGTNLHLKKSSNSLLLKESNDTNVHPYRIDVIANK